MKRQKTIYVNDSLARLIGKKKVSTRLNEIADRYEKMCFHCATTDFTNEELLMLKDFIRSSDLSELSVFRNILYSKISSGVYSEEGWVQIYEKLKLLSYPSIVSLVEELSK